QPSEFLSMYTIVIIRLLTYSRPRFSVLSRDVKLKEGQKLIFQDLTLFVFYPIYALSPML
ncbi:MAG: hypothetical protein JW976_14175, partial [Syntrophaceae bacterium]|nr:hypothetical protein [Syntrophaceae bacterium]